MNESKITNNILKWLNSLQYCKAEKLFNGGMFVKKGMPDIYGCMNGRMFVIEVKVVGKAPTELQYKRLKEWQEAGALAIWANSLEVAQMKFKNAGWL